jgi:hypothetical protein
MGISGQQVHGGGVIPASGQELPDGQILLIFYSRFAINASERVKI